MDAKRISGLTQIETQEILTLTELEVTASLGLSRLLTLNGTAITCEESVVLEVLLVFSVDLHQRTCDGETQGLALAGETTAVEVGLDIVLLCDLEQLDRKSVV